MLWITSCQYSVYSKEINSLQKHKTGRRRLLLVRQLRLFLDNTNLWCGGRIHNGPVEQCTKFPYLLPANHKLTALIVYATYAKQLHGGVLSTATALKEHCWIPTAQRVVTKLLRKCVICRRGIGKLFLSLTLPHYQ